jgi:RNA polymerase sigma factor (TIGR02999 family)
MDAPDDPAGGRLTPGDEGAAGDGEALDELAAQLYPELRRLARRAMRGERSGHTLQTTALVHELYLRLADGELAVESRAHFLALSARVMRRILIDHARGHDRLKRAGDQVRVSLTRVQDELAVEEATVEVLALDRALRSLQNFDPRRARLLELQLFGGLTYPEMAEALEISEATVHRELRLARAWLQRDLAGGS